jgi:cytochrome oxidase assembly protein ShyY1
MNGYRFLRQPRWLALGFLVLVIVPSFVLLSRWQLHRLDDRRHANAVISANSTTAPVPVQQLVSPGTDVTVIGDDQTWRQVSATGHYDESGQVLVRKRPFEGRNGFWVATPFVTSTGTVLVVNRGWVEAVGGASAGAEVPAPPSGTVSIVGRLQPSEVAPASQPTDLPAGQVTDLDVRLVAGTAAVYPGYVDLVSSTPPQAAGLTALPLPDLSDGPHLSYALQWILFALVAIGGFVVLVRREALDADGADSDDAADSTLDDVQPTDLSDVPAGARDDDGSRT